MHLWKVSDELKIDDLDLPFPTPDMDEFIIDGLWDMISHQQMDLAFSNCIWQRSQMTAKMDDLDLFCQGHVMLGISPIRFGM